MWRILREAGRNWSQDNASHLGAAVAYYALFSVTPLLMLVLDVTALALGPMEARNQLAEHLALFIGPEAAQAVQSLLQSARAQEAGWPSRSVAIGVLLITAANLFLQVKTGLRIIWKLPPLPTDSPVGGTIKDWLLAMVMVSAVSIFWLLLALCSTLLGVFIELWGDVLPGGTSIWRATGLGVWFLLLTVLLTMTFRLLSGRRIRYRHLWKGAALSSLLFLLGKTVFAWYVKLMGANLASAYGAASSLIIFLIWVYYSAQILYMGAEVVKAQRTAHLSLAPCPNS
jgi:membrane protein